MLLLVALLCGFIFGCGLLVSGMISPAKVLAFLDVLGAWDPSLLVVMAAAVAVTEIGYIVARRRERPLLANQCEWPTKTAIDVPLVVGAMMFGAGWGLVGLCPGPAVENLVTLSPQLLVFVAAMLAGMTLHDFWYRHRTYRHRTMDARPPGPSPVGADG